MARDGASDPYRGLPSTQRLLNSPRVQAATNGYIRSAAVWHVRATLDELRRELRDGKELPPFEEIVNRIAREVENTWHSHPTPVINATGVVLHTNLGRAPLAPEVTLAVQSALQYSDLELDRQSGARGSRLAGVVRQLRDLTGAESAHVTVNAASALLLSLAAVARGKQVLVSRGQSVEIGGGFRVPVIAQQSGARLIEVGTTNRTRIEDFEDALSEKTAAVLHVHRSNFRQIGFTEDASLTEMSRLARSRGIVLVDDNGSGALLDTASFGLEHEPMPTESLQAGSDIVVFSGDKLLGGPQAGIILGRRDLVSRLSRHPLARALRPDKVILAALSATLSLYLRGTAAERVPIWNMIGQSEATMRSRAKRWSERAANCGVSVELEDGRSTVGGGSLPEQSLPTTLIRLPRSVSARQLRCSSPAVIAISRASRTFLDLRTVASESEDALLQVVLAAVRGNTSASRAETTANS